MSSHPPRHPDTRYGIRTNYHLAHMASQHCHPSQQGAYYSVPLDHSANTYLTMELPTNPVPTRHAQSQNAACLSGTTEVGVTREAAFKKLSGIFNPTLVFKVMDQYPDITDAKHLRDIILKCADDI